MLDNLLSLKLNSINLFNYVMQVFIDNSSIEKENSFDLNSLLFFSKIDDSLIDNLIEPSNSVLITFEGMKRIKENLI
jgi:hypothetical protein